MMATERACVLVGGFLGGILVFLQFWPHFQIVPKPPTEIIITCARLVLLSKNHLMLKKRMITNGAPVGVRRTYVPLRPFVMGNADSVHATHEIQPGLLTLVSAVLPGMWRSSVRASMGELTILWNSRCTTATQARNWRSPLLSN